MPLSVTHVISTVILIDIFRDHIAKHKRYFTMKTMLVGAIASILPDVDIVLDKIITFLGFSPSLLKHGGMTHTIIFGLVFLIPAFIFLKKKQHRRATYFFVITFACLFHIFLDFLLGGGHHAGIMLLWPFSSQRFRIGLLGSDLNSNFLALDAIMLISWLFYMVKMHKIRDFF